MADPHKPPGASPELVSMLEKLNKTMCNVSGALTMHRKQTERIAGATALLNVLSQVETKMIGYASTIEDAQKAASAAAETTKGHVMSLRKEVSDLQVNLRDMDRDKKKAMAEALELEGKLEATEESLRVATEKNTDLEHKLQTSEGQKKEADATIFDLRRRLEASEEGKKEADATTSNLRQRLEASEKEKKEADAATSNLRQRLEASEKKEEAAETTAKGLRVELAEEKEKATLKASEDAESLKAAQGEVATLISQVSAAGRSEHERNGQMKKLTSELAEVEKTLAKEQDAVKAVDLKYAEEQRLKTKADGDSEKLQKEAKSLRRQMEKMKTNSDESTKLKKEVEDLRQQMQGMHSSNDELQKEYHREAKEKYEVQRKQDLEDFDIQKNDLRVEAEDGADERYRNLYNRLGEELTGKYNEAMRKYEEDSLKEYNEAKKKYEDDNLKQYNDSLKDFSAKTNANSKRAHDKFDSDLAKKQQELDGVKTEAATAQGEFQDKLTMMQGDLDAAKTSAASAENALETKLSRKQRELDDAERKATTAQGEFQAKLTKMQGDLDMAKRSAEIAQGTFDSDLANKEEELDAAIRDATAAQSKFQEELAKKLEAVDRLTQEVSSGRDLIRGLEQKQTELTAQMWEEGHVRWDHDRQIRDLEAKAQGWLTLQAAFYERKLSDGIAWLVDRAVSRDVKSGRLHQEAVAELDNSHMQDLKDERERAEIQSQAVIDAACGDMEKPYEESFQILSAENVRLEAVVADFEKKMDRANGRQFELEGELGWRTFEVYSRDVDLRDLRSRARRAYGVLLELVEDDLDDLPSLPKRGREVDISEPTRESKRSRLQESIWSEADSLDSELGETPRYAATRERLERAKSREILEQSPDLGGDGELFEEGYSDADVQVQPSTGSVHDGDEEDGPREDAMEDEGPRLGFDFDESVHDEAEPRPAFEVNAMQEDGPAMGNFPPSDDAEQESTVHEAVDVEQLSIDGKVDHIMSMFLIGWQDCTTEEVDMIRAGFADILNGDRSVETVIEGIDHNAFGPQTKKPPYPRACLWGQLGGRAFGEGGRRHSQRSCPGCKKRADLLCCWVKFLPNVGQGFKPRDENGRLAKEDYGYDKNAQPRTLSVGGHELRWVLKKRKRVMNDPDEELLECDDLGGVRL